MRSLYREQNSWLTAIRCFAVLTWLETIPSPPSLFILPLKKSSSLAMKTCPQHESQNMRRYGDINHERKKKKSRQISFGTPGDGTWDSQPAGFEGRCLDSAARCIYSFFFFFTRWGGEDCVASPLERPWCGTNVFSMKQRGSVFFFSFPHWLGPPVVCLPGFSTSTALLHSFLSFLLPKNSSSATEDTQDLFTSLWPLVGIEGSRHFGFGLGGSGVALRHVVLFFFSQGTHARTFCCGRSNRYRNKSNEDPFIALISADFQMSQLPTSRHDGPALAAPPSHPSGNFSRSGRCPPPLRRTSELS